MRSLLFLLLSILALPASAVSAIDDDGIRVELARPAQRIVSLAPHVTELLFAVGAGDRIVGAAEYSDYPEAARTIPRIGSALQMDLERIIGLQPDLVVAWRSGNPAHQVARLRQLGIPVYVTEPRTLDSIPDHLQRLGTLTGTGQTASAAVKTFRERLAGLRASVSRTPRLRVFYQVSLTPLYTVNGDHIISEVIELCGGANIFAQLGVIAPTVSLEAVLREQPEVILAADTGARYREEVNAYWAPWTTLDAVTRGNVFYINPDVISRATPRILSGAGAICEALATARQRH